MLCREVEKGTDALLRKLWYDCLSHHYTLCHIVVCGDGDKLADDQICQYRISQICPCSLVLTH